jgi:hypothetical protein
MNYQFEKVEEVEEVVKDKVDILIEKTKCKGCLEVRNNYLDKVNWDKSIIDEVHEHLAGQICSKHLLKDIVMLSETIEEVKGKLCFHEVRDENDKLVKAPMNHTECCVSYLPTLINQKAIHRRKSKEFINGVVEYVLSAKEKVFRNLKPHILKKYMKNAPITIEFYSQFKIDQKYFPLCIENGYPYKESLEACFKKKRAKDLFSYIELITIREKERFEVERLETERLEREAREQEERDERQGY